MPNRGEIWIANLNPRRGTEPGKTQPVLVVQSQSLLDAAHPSTVIVPLTTNLIDDAKPLRIRIPAQQSLRHDSDVLIDQIRAIDSQFLLQGPLLRLDGPTMDLVGAAISEVLELV